ncbi:MAG TPA: hypothetical protein VFG83_10950 [Kofleriaceae bacterium]|nr:hypothetical protein [Kofleriaceae bacterium]
MRRSLCFLVCALILAGGGCRSVQIARVQPQTVAVAPGLRPLAAIQANAISAYILFVPIPGVDLDTAVNQMLIVAAKTMGADKVILVDFDATPPDGIWAWRKLFLWRSARASGIAVQVVAPAPDPNADLGPEAPGAREIPPASAPAPAPQTPPPAQ